MKAGDYVAKIKSKWQEHNPWMQFPDEPSVLLGVIISKGSMKHSWDVLESSGRISSHRQTTLKVISKS